MILLTKWVKRIRRAFHQFIRDWNTFWFRPVETIHMAAFRCCFGLVLLFMYIIRFFDFEIFFSEKGLLSPAAARVAGKQGGPYNIDLVLNSDVLLYVLYFVLLGSALLLMLYGGRWLALIVFVLHLIFMKRNPLIAYTADYIATFFLFYLIFVHSSRQLNWLRYFREKGRSLVLNKTQNSSWFEAVGMRLIQIHLCVIYMYSGFEKLRNDHWWQGISLEKAALFGDFNNHLFNLSFLVDWPAFRIFFLLSSAFIVLFELYFPVLIWVFSKKLLLVAGLFVHILMVVFLDMYFHSLLLLSAYVLFISPDSLRSFFCLFQRK